MSLETYLKDINKIKLLSPEREKEIAYLIKKGDKEAREEMIKANLRLVVNIAKKYINCGLPLQDLIEEGNIGLLKAVERFEPDKNCRFSTYATWWIKQAIRRALTDYSKVVRMPSYMKEIVSKADEISERLTVEMGKPPTLSEIAYEMEKNPELRKRTENVLKISSNLSHIQSLDKICDQREIIEDPSQREKEINQEDIERLELLLKSLDKRRRKILRMRFGIETGKQMTLQQISEKVNLSRERVRQIIKESLVRLRAIVESYS